jgi:hypothetical protein
MNMSHQDTPQSHACVVGGSVSSILADDIDLKHGKFGRLLQTIGDELRIDQDKPGYPEDRALEHLFDNSSGQ